MKNYTVCTTFLMESGHRLSEDSIRRDLRKVGIHEETWFDLAQVRILWRTFITTASFASHRVVILSLQKV